jgi:predicted ATP-grasp superfamily ATP-dependent carboligase
LNRPHGFETLRDIKVKNPVLILGAGLRLTLTIARSLHRQGIPVIVAPLTPGESPIRSRAIRKHVGLPDFRAKPDKFILELTGLIQAEGVDMIMPTGDGALAAISNHYDVLQRLAHVGAPPPAIIERVLDKNLTLAAARKCQVPVPASRVIEDPSNLDELLEGLQFPLIAKPAVRKGNSSYKIKYFETKEKLLISLSKDRDSWGGSLLQEYIPGVGKGIGILMHKGIPMAMFQHRRIKELPYTGGVSVMAEAEVIDQVLADHAVALLREIEWQGIAMVEYRCNPIDNRFALMEINGRYWGSLFLAAQAGVDFPYYEWQLAHGEQPETAKPYTPGIKARWLVGDVLRLHGIVNGSHFSEIEPVSRGKEAALSQIPVFVRVMPCFH